MANSTKRRAIIIDLDGTYCDHNHRGELWIMHPRPIEQILQEIPHDGVSDWCHRIIESYNSTGHKIIFLTARTHEFKEATLKWLERVAGKFDYELHIRNEQEPMDKLNDASFKGLKLLMDILPHYEVDLAIDDKDACCQMFRAHGINTLLCSNGFKR